MANRFSTTSDTLGVSEEIPISKELDHKFDVSQSIPTHVERIDGTIKEGEW